MWHVFEESIWAITIFGMTVCCYFLYTTLLDLKEKARVKKEEKIRNVVDMENVEKFLKYFLVRPPYILPPYPSYRVGVWSSICCIYVHGGCTYVLQEMATRRSQPPSVLLFL